jgi:hypothetical protein
VIRTFALAAAVALVGVPGWVAKPSPSPAVDRAVTVTVDNNETSVLEHGRTIYRITVRNDSDVDYPAAFIAQMLPAALSFGESVPAPSKRTENTLESAHTSEVQWVRHLPAHGEITIDMTAAVGVRPENGTLSTTACVLPDGKTRPLICDTDQDPVGGRAFPLGWLLVGVVVAGGVALLAGWFFKAHRRSASG